MTTDYRSYQEKERERKSNLPSITRGAYDKLPSCCKGIYEDFDGTAVNWKGLRTVVMGMIDPKLGHQLGVETVHFRIGY